MGFTRSFIRGVCTRPLFMIYRTRTNETYLDLIKISLKKTKCVYPRAESEGETSTIRHYSTDVSKMFATVANLAPVRVAPRRQGTFTRISIDAIIASSRRRVRSRGDHGRAHRS